MVSSHAPIPNIADSSKSVSSHPCQQCEEKNQKGKASSLEFNYGTTLQLATRLLDLFGIDTPELDAEVLLRQVCNKSQLALALARKENHSQSMFEEFFALIARRLCHEPVAYIVGKKEFFGLDLTVTHDCLIPRPDTETVVEQCLNVIAPDEDGLVLELCTGSGAIILALLQERSHLSAIASDISHRALLVAEGNARALQLHHRLQFRQGDLFAPFAEHEKARLIVVNPPYISSDEMAHLPRSVRDFEPHDALDGKDAQGLYFYRRILQEAPAFLKAKGYLILEIGFDQRDAIVDLVGDQWSDVKIVKDLGQRDRCVVLQFRG